MPAEATAKVYQLDAYRGVSNKSSALDRALDQIDKAFGPAAMHRDFKGHVKRLLKLGIYDPGFRARFGRRAKLLAGMTLNDAIVEIELMYREEKKVVEIGRTFGLGSAHTLTVLREMRLMLRLMRRRGPFYGISGRHIHAVIRTVAGLDDYRVKKRNRSRS